MIEKILDKEDEMKAPEVEMIDDNFWLKLSTVLVTESGEKLDLGSQRVATALAWFWTVYAGASSVVLLYLDKELTVLQSLLIISPIPILFIAYVVATWASLPVDFAFDVRSPENIKAVHEELVRIKKSRLRISMALAGLTVVLISAAMINMALNKPTHVSESSAILLAGSDIQPEIVASGKAPEKTNVLIRVVTAGYPLQQKIVTANRQNRFTISMAVHPAPQYKVELSWSDPDTRTIIQEVILNKNFPDGQKR